jgi:hypothetical protein
MQPTAQPASQSEGMATAPTAHTRAETGDGLSSLLGAGQFLEAVIEHIPAVVFVKDARDFRFIREAGCTQCQGYLFGRAIPNDEVMRLMHLRRQAIRKPGYA